MVKRKRKTRVAASNSPVRSDGQKVILTPKAHEKANPRDGSDGSKVQPIEDARHAMETCAPPEPSDASALSAASDSDEEAIEYRHDSILRVASQSRLFSPPSADEEQEEDKTPIAKRTRQSLGDDASQQQQPEARKAQELKRKDSALSTPKKEKDTEGKNYNVVLSGEMCGVHYAVARVEKAGMPISGTAWVSVMRGVVQVFGAVLHEEDRPVLVSSAPYTPFILSLTVHERVRGAESVRQGRRMHPEAIAHMKVRSHVAGQIPRRDASPHLTLLTSTGDEGICEPVETDGLQNCTDVFRSTSVFPQIGKLPAMLGGTRLTSTASIPQEGSKYGVFREWGLWKQLCGDIEAEMREKGNARDVRVLVYGASGTGKSTVTRCLVNRLLTHCEGVVFVDTDVGQPEMSVSGMVSAHVVKECRIGTGLGSVRGVPLCGRYLGETTAREAPELYAKYVEEVVGKAREVASREGWAMVVNSDGWVGGVGAELLKELGRLCEAGYLVESRMEGEGERKWLSEAMWGGGAKYVMERAGSRDVSGMRGRVYREMLCGGYFWKEMWMGRVYRVEGMKVRVVEDGWDGEFCVGALVNAGLVAVGVADGEGGTEVVGMGIVRGVEQQGEVLYVSSAVQWERLRECDTMVMSGAVQVPKRLFEEFAQLGDGDDRVMPHLMSGAAASGNAMASRATLVRRNQVAM
ncbi:pre-mRNA cleavage complex related [Chondrus crispus]|uniref:Pre-mRNA cleavage complex related n=1 Tax=Chondrus crispus TaxID=2769 RepID=R7QQJ6_CHOCR|nr:pre-mRNA cleavage complex related [Chondrus crispus]CDF40399.1 pre-mRNA cleavage complex related [Chondrus crispus]|eukprot:XP_005710693.1 pre-mRNA cleavage complex related [Chondrus crispus]